MIAKLALSASGIPSNNLNGIRTVISRIEVICNVHYLINKLSDCSFLHWHQVLLPVYFSKIMETKPGLPKCSVSINFNYINSYFD